MKNVVKFKKMALTAMMSLIVISVLSVGGYAATYSTKVSLALGADTADGYISALDNNLAYSKQFTYGHSYTGLTPIWLTGYISVAANTDRGNTSGGIIRLNVEEKNLFLWLIHETQDSTCDKITIENTPNMKTYSINTSEENRGYCRYTNGKTYRGRFRVEYLCAASEISKVKVHPSFNYVIFIDD